MIRIIKLLILFLTTVPFLPFKVVGSLAALILSFFFGVKDWASEDKRFCLNKDYLYVIGLMWSDVNDFIKKCKKSKPL